MKKALFISLALISSAATLKGQEALDSIKLVKLNEVAVFATRVLKGSPATYSNLNEQQIKSENAAKNIPSMLQTLPSVVAYTEGGTAVGNTSYRIRGTDANRINVTLNGMPLNNPESQEVYWVNLPDLSNSLQSIQVQRGVGTSTNGAASFGGSISLQTQGGKSKPYADLSAAYGQYNTLLLSASAGTGVLKNGLSFDARYSSVQSDGYIRNAKADHSNLYTAISHYSDNQLIRLAYMNGIQHTGITWEGLSPELLAVDRRYNPAGEYRDENGNIAYYDNETDNYYSNIGQLIYTRYLSNKWTLNINGSYNNGYGYYENYKTDQKFSKYGLQNQIVDGTVLNKSDMIRRKLMSNDFYTGSFNVDYKNNKLEITAGGMYGYYTGVHYGRLIWVKENENVPQNYEWNRNSAVKKDMNIFAKAVYRPLRQLSVFAEVQNRYVDYRMQGMDDDLADLTNNSYYYFVNPQAGLSYQLDENNEAYASFGVSNREPLRSDLKESLKGGGSRTISAERLSDYELGYKHAASVISFSANAYYMNYKDQLVQTGKLNDTGYKLQENVPESYRMGVELSLTYEPLRWLRVDGNLTLSRNKIKNYTAYFDYYDNQNDWTYLGQISQFYKSTDISFSPNVVGNAVLTITPFEKKDIRFSFTNKYVGRMYYDNTSNVDNSLPPYFVTDIAANYSLKLNKKGIFDFQLFINNIFNAQYSANAWAETVKFADQSEVTYKALFPQAPTNVMGRVRYRF